jgi:hypothetical protein
MLLTILSAGVAEDLCSSLSAHTFDASLAVTVNARPLLLPSGIAHDPEGLTMTPQFLRDEAARFRDMAGTADREATKSRLLAMAADHESRANIADETIESSESSTIEVLAASNQDNSISEIIEPRLPGAIRGSTDSMVARELNEPVAVRRRPVGRPRRE